MADNALIFSTFFISTEKPILDTTFEISKRPSFFHVALYYRYTINPSRGQAVKNKTGEMRNCLQQKVTTEKIFTFRFIVFTEKQKLYYNADNSQYIWLSIQVTPTAVCSLADEDWSHPRTEIKSQLC